MKRNIILTLSLAMVSAIGWAQLVPAHTEVGYSPATNTMTTLRFGRGNTLESITISGKTHTTIRVAANGQPKQISNELATVDYTFAGASNVKVTQTVNGQTKTQNVPMNSKQVLDFRAEYSTAQKSLPAAIDKADKFLENGGAKLIGNILNTINEGLENPINACFQQALEAAQKTDNPIIPISTLEGLVKATQSHKEQSLTDKAKDAAVDYLFNNYGEWRDGLGNAIYQGLMEIDKRQQADNKKEQQGRVALAKLLLDNGASLEEAAKMVDEAFKGGGINLPNTPNNPDNPNNPNKPNDPNNPDDQGNQGDEGQGKPEDQGNYDYINKLKNEWTICEGLIPMETPQDVFNYIKMKSKQLRRRMPNKIYVSYERRFAPLANRTFTVFINKDKKSFRVEEYSKDNPDALERDEPYVQLIVNGPPDWAIGCCWNQTIVIPLKKISND